MLVLQSNKCLRRDRCLLKQRLVCVLRAGCQTACRVQGAATHPHIHVRRPLAIRPGIPQLSLHFEDVPPVCLHSPVLAPTLRERKGSLVQVEAAHSVSTHTELEHFGRTQPLHTPPFPACVVAISAAKETPACGHVCFRGASRFKFVSSLRHDAASALVCTCELPSVKAPRTRTAANQPPKWSKPG